MVPGQDESGLTLCDVMDQRLSLATVVIVAGVHTTVDITRTFPLHAIGLCLLTVSDYFIVAYFSVTILSSLVKCLMLSSLKVVHAAKTVIQAKLDAHLFIPFLC